MTRFPVKYSDRLVATAALKVLDFKFLKVLESVRLSLRQCGTFKRLSGHLESVLHYPRQQCLLSNIFKLDHQKPTRKRAHTKPSTGL